MNFCRFVALPILALAALGPAQVPTPKSFLGFDVCDDYQLANYEQLVDYWKLLAKSSNRIKLQSIGKTEAGREQMMAFISDPSNLRSLEENRQLSKRIASGKPFKDDLEAEQFFGKGKSIVWIDGGLHANEVLSAQQLIETAYQLTSRNDEENRRILKDVIILLVHANPDGMDLVSNWYMRRKEPEKRSLAGVPVLYQKYAGHDNNRDFYQMNLAETRNMNRILYETWFPQIMYNHHQSAPNGTIMFIPPFRNPFNYHIDPIIQTGTDLLGLHMHQRLMTEGLGGTVMRNGASFSTWYNGGLRTTTYFHNMIGILTETWGSPNPAEVPFIANRQLPTTDIPMPVTPGLWHLKHSLKYEIGANYAILDYASRYRSRLLRSVWTAANQSIERGSRDYWTRYPRNLAAFGAESLKRPELRDARSYVISADQPDPGAAQRFVEILLRSGIQVLTDGDGRYIVQTNQAYRPHILDMFEPQDHPNDLQYPGGPPIAPYDSAGYTPAYTMGVKFERHLQPYVGKTMFPVATAKGRITFKPGESFAPFSQNDSYRLANLAKQSGYAVTESEKGFYISGDVTTLLNSFGRLYPNPERTPPSSFPAYQPPRIAVLDRYGGNMPSGWTRWMLDEFNFSHTTLFPPDIATGKLEQFDIVIVPSSLIANNAGSSNALASLQDDPTVPAEYRARIGSFDDKVLDEIKEFIEHGGHVVAIGSSSLPLGRRLGQLVSSGMVDEKGAAYPNTKYYIPASVLNIKLHPGPLTAGMEDSLDIMFDDSPVFRYETAAPGTLTTIREIGSYVLEKPLRSGWALGQELLQRKAAMLDITMGKGKLVLLGPEVNFRGQSHASFKLIFNAIRRAGKK